MMAKLGIASRRLNLVIMLGGEGVNWFVVLVREYDDLMLGVMMVVAMDFFWVGVMLLVAVMVIFL